LWKSYLREGIFCSPQGSKLKRLKVKVISSAILGRKSKRLSSSILYVCTDEGLLLGNKYDSFIPFTPIPPRSRGIGVHKVALNLNKSACQPQRGIEKFMTIFPTEEIDKIVDYCVQKKVKELHLGNGTFPYDSHAYLIAEYISPTGVPFSLTDTRGEPKKFKNQRDFERALPFFPISLRNHYILRFQELINSGEELFLENMPTIRAYN
jgi:hypothetical protein